MSSRISAVSAAVFTLFLAQATLAKAPEQAQAVPVKSTKAGARSRAARGQSPKPTSPAKEHAVAAAEAQGGDVAAPERSALTTSGSTDKTAAERVGDAGAHAHPTAGRMQVQGTLGDGSDSLGVGIGVRAGYTLSDKVYVGGVARASYYWNPVASATWVRPGIEAGYDFSAGPVVIRPYAGAGFAFVRATVSVPGLYDASASTTVGAFLGGAQVFGYIPKTPVFLGGDVHAVVFTSSWGESHKVPLDFSVLAGTHFL